MKGQLNNRESATPFLRPARLCVGKISPAKYASSGRSNVTPRRHVGNRSSSRPTWTRKGPGRRPARRPPTGQSVRRDGRGEEKQALKDADTWEKWEKGGRQSGLMAATGELARCLEKEKLGGHLIPLWNMGKLYKLRLWRLVMFPQSTS